MCRQQRQQSRMCWLAALCMCHLSYCRAFSCHDLLIYRGRDLVIYTEVYTALAFALASSLSQAEDQAFARISTLKFYIFGVFSIRFKTQQPERMYCDCFSICVYVHKHENGQCAFHAVVTALSLCRHHHSEAWFLFFANFWFLVFVFACVGRYPEAVRSV